MQADALALTLIVILTAHTVRQGVADITDFVVQKVRPSSPARPDASDDAAPLRRRLRRPSQEWNYGGRAFPVAPLPLNARHALAVGLEQRLPSLPALLTPHLAVNSTARSPRAAGARRGRSR